MSTWYNIIWDIQYENMLLRAKYEELEEENNKLYKELAEKTTPRYEVVTYTIFVIVWAIAIGIGLQATFWILPNV